jgi:isoleucyl-tRNA synthetase
MDYKETLNLPRTAFPMRANLPKREPEMLKKWEDAGLYHRIVASGQGREKYILHDGPPYANGRIHLGTALNKILKDMIVKSRHKAGYDSTYVPGWDCHGLPIEHEVDKELGGKKKGMSSVEVRRYCRKYAEKFIALQREEFKRLGVLGLWEEPYLTMNYAYQAVIVRELGKFFASGAVYRGKKPVYWCSSCVTALAEAEVEYKDAPTPSIFVRFKAREDFSSRIPELRGKDVSVVIWTTTPWTIPANLAVAVHPDESYAAVEAGGKTYILAERLVPVNMEEFGLGDYKTLATFPGRVLEGLLLTHPLYDRESRLILAPFVTLDTGAGCVHIAPGHGQEDYEVGLEYGLEVYAPLDDRGRYTDDVDFFAGKFVFDANKDVTAKLDEFGALLASAEMNHSYPHCWRCKKPVIFRATHQWFISMDRTGLRAKALKAIDDVQWIPKWGRDRIYGMIQHRPDWCVSRQRSWGVPIPALRCAQCDETLTPPELFEKTAAAFEKDGADIWFEASVESLAPEGLTCPKCGGRSFEKGMDILDVWFDSGVSWAAVCEQDPRLSSPCALYLEGSDQHRGWFHSALLTSVGTRGRAPYRGVLTHGFVVDGDGKKMSKSVGNVIQPKEIIDKFGADVLRLWVSAEDYRDDIRISKEILDRLSEAYRRIRNTCRFLLGNLAGFDARAHAVDLKEMRALDRWALHRLNQLIRKTRAAYDNFDFHVVFHSLYNFCTIDMSSLYLDILKDRLYCEAKDGTLRRSAQTALHHVLSAMTRLMAPILSFTADEVWAEFASADPGAVHLELFPGPVGEWDLEPEEADMWESMIALRQTVSRALEEARASKLIGSSLEAKVLLRLPQKLFARFQTLEDPAGFFIVSQVEAELASENGDAEKDDLEKVQVNIVRAEGAKCARCWMWTKDVGANADYPDICGRCASVMRGSK